MPGTVPTARDILVEARSLIAKPVNWTQGTGARDTDGEPIGVEHQVAVSWCATGAINCTAIPIEAAVATIPNNIQRHLQMLAWYSCPQSVNVAFQAATKTVLGYRIQLLSAR